MKTVPILTFPHPDLQKQCSKIVVIDEKVLEFIEILKETLFESGGVGLASPQIGASCRIIAVASPESLKEGIRTASIYINPEIIEQEGEILTKEGCLSFPGLFRDVKRFRKITVQAFDEKGQGIQIVAENLYAVCLQHEIDHLNGILFVDRLSPMRKKLAMKTYLNSKKRVYLEN